MHPLRVYLIPGLGADERVFARLILDAECRIVSWLPPQPNESLAVYCQRLVVSHNVQPHAVLVGVSFGGIIAQEIARLVPVQKIILVSSVKSRLEVPRLFRWAGKLRLHQALPYAWLVKPNLLLRYAFGPMTSDEYKLLKGIIRDTNPDFLKWAITHVLTWQNDIVSPTLLHIHGTHDRIFPVTGTRNFIPVSKGGHFMIVSQATRINTLINQALITIGISPK